MRQGILLFLGIFAFIFSVAHFSDADFTVRKEIVKNSFKATVLDFFSRNSASEEKIETLFNLGKFIPTGVESKIVRLVAEEENLKTSVSIKFYQNVPSKQSCQDINLLVFRHWNKIYEGSVGDFIVNLERLEKKEDLVFILSRKAESNVSGQCVFDFVFEAGKENGGFFAKRVLSNLIVM